jgi:hypothetical protein
VNLGAENKRNVMLAAVLGIIALLAVVWELMPSSSTIASTTPVAASTSTTSSILTPTRAPVRQHTAKTAAPKKERATQSLDPTLHLHQLAAIEEIKYEGSGRNIFVSQADVEIPKPLAPGQTDPAHVAPLYQLPAAAAFSPIPLKFFGFANQPGEPKRIFLSKGEDVFIAGEGEIVDRRYKVVRISPTSVEIQDVVGSGPAQNIPLTQG